MTGEPRTVSRCGEVFESTVSHIGNLRCELDPDHPELHYAQFERGWMRWSTPDRPDGDVARRSDAEIREALLTRPWFAVPDDTLGGWAVANVARPVSLHDHRRGDVTVGEFLSEELAQHVVELHNRALRRGDDDRSDALAAALAELCDACEHAIASHRENGCVELVSTNVCGCTEYWSSE